ncbi:asparagine synthase [Caulobacter sp. 602-2]|uniref:Asparagine synthase n=1 Tax=Caulobacter sp. 602-2 TaxID=2710887 RepID=A0A6G4QWQ7_9CAUL|nr:asparagine synthase C-terminal domain-containing protein [Caulobacter sp. 602-2]NGM49378.1 asparagine synthase [Caulobacter sp. 602-2]
MRGYLVLNWPPGQPGDLAGTLKDALLADGWRVAYEAFCLLALVRGARPPPVQALPGQCGVAVGRLHDTEASLAGQPAAFDLSLLSGLEAGDGATLLSRCAWGAYVALFTARDRAPTVFRDPLGGLECVTWSVGPVTLVGDDPPVCGPAAPPGLAIDWERVGDLLADIALISAQPCLTGIRQVGAGQLWSCADGGRRAVWTPGDHAWRSGGVDVEEAQERLARCVDGCVRTLAVGRRAIVAEVSGGFDSSLVALHLARAKAPIAALTNLHWPHAAGDERDYARAVADRIGQPLTSVARGDLRFDPADFELRGQALRPPFSAQDAEYDRDMAGRLSALQADALFTGHGGDVVFYQMPEAALARDLVGGGACLVGRARGLGVLAQRLRSNVGLVLIEAFGPRGRRPPGLAAPRYLTRRTARTAHPWLADLKGVGGAKRVQIRALVNTLMMQGDSRRGDVAEVVNPLLSQPLVELCLSLPASLLAIGDHDRPLARAAFADMLPAALRTRRGKGDVTAVFARSLAASADLLRPWLLQGRLVEQGLVDPARLAPMLEPDELIWRDHTGEIMRAVVVEAWVRTWAARLAGEGQGAAVAPAPLGAGAS